MLARHRERGAAATIALTPLQSPFGIVELAEDDTVTGFREAPRLPHWVNVGVYVLDEEALARLPERGDHEQTTFPELAREGKLLGWRHEGTWLTVNTPKQLRLAAEFVSSHPEFLAA
jgi:NDP-sugar pyrophosphorylase family protein